MEALLPTFLFIQMRELGLALISILIIILINVMILRWVFRVNEIVSLLKKILRGLKPPDEPGE